MSRYELVSIEALFNKSEKPFGYYLFEKEPAMPKPLRYAAQVHTKKDVNGNSNALVFFSSKD